MGAANLRAGGARARPRRYGLRLPSSSTPPIRCASSCPVDHLPQRSITKISHCTAVRLAQSRGRRCPVANTHESGPLAAYLPAPVRSRCFSAGCPVLCPTGLANPQPNPPPAPASGVVDHQASLDIARQRLSDAPNVIIRCKCSHSIQKACTFGHIFVARPGAARASTINRGFPVA